MPAVWMTRSRSCAKRWNSTAHSTIAHYNLAQALELKGLIPEATAEYQKTMSMTEDPVPLGMLGRLYALHGQKDEALTILQRLRQSREQRYTAAYGLALIYVGLGDRNEALNWLEQGYREHDGFNIGPIRVDPLLDSAARRSAIRSAGGEDCSGAGICKGRNSKMNFDNFFAELKRRNVYKVAVAYAVVGWLVGPSRDAGLSVFRHSEWVVRLVVLAIVIGFPIALVIAWAFELTPEGLKRTEDVDLAAHGSAENARVDLCRDHRRGAFDRIVFYRSLHGPKYRQCGSHRDGDGFIHSAKIDRGVAVRKSERRQERRLFRRRHSG